MSMKDIMEQQIEKIDASEVAGFWIERSTTGNNLYSVFCVNKQGERLAAVAVDLTADQATDLVSTLNTPYDADPLLTELVEVEDGAGNVRMFYAAK